jgi:hypothetical protein
MLIDDYVPDVWAHRFTKSHNVPALKSASAVLQEHLSPEHAAHHSAVAAK